MKTLCLKIFFLNLLKKIKAVRLDLAHREKGRAQLDCRPCHMTPTTFTFLTVANYIRQG